jgi:casein kinase I family protein HRR25
MRSAQSRRDDIESLAYSLLECLRELPWAGVTGGTQKQIEEKVREKKRSWTPDRLCAGIPEAFKIIFSHARELAYDEEPDYAFLRQRFMTDMDRHGYSLESPFDWSDAGSKSSSCHGTTPLFS